MFRYYTFKITTKANELTPDTTGAIILYIETDNIVFYIYLFWNLR